MTLSEEDRKMVLTKLEKLMSHTSDGGVNINEIAVANKKMKELMDKYGISLSEIKNSVAPEKLVFETSFQVTAFRPRLWVGYLQSNIGDFYECKCIMSRKRSTGCVCCFIGFDLDANIAKNMFEKLYTQIHQAGLKATEIPNEIRRQTRVNDFCMGCVTTIMSRLDEIKAEKEFQQTREALVVVKKEVIDKTVKDLYPNLRESSGSQATFGHSDDYYSGREYGKSIEIHKGIK